jgi:signal peptidase II
MIYWILIIVIIALDQFTKFLAIRDLMPVGTIELLPGIFHLTFTRNTGAAFSILRDKQLILIVFTFLVILFLVGFLFRQIRGNGSVLLLFSLAMIIGGAVGNLIDRMRFNYVVDFADFAFINFAVFNVADVFITFGTIALMVYVLIDGKAFNF